MSLLFRSSGNVVKVTSHLSLRSVASSVSDGGKKSKTKVVKNADSPNGKKGSKQIKTESSSGTSTAPTPSNPAPTPSNPAPTAPTGGQSTAPPSQSFPPNQPAGNEYKAMELFSYNIDTYADLFVDMEKHRLPRPSNKS